MKKIFIILLLSGLFVACASKDKKEKQEDGKKPSLHYTVSGNGNETLLFVHGYGINGSYWDNQVNYFRDKYKVVTVDLAGHGQSTAAPDTTTAEKMAEGIDSLIDYLKLDNIILIGHSMSGNINLHVVEKYPELVKGFIGIDNLQQVGHELTDQEKKEGEQFMDTLKKDYKNIIAQFANALLFHPTTGSAIKERVIHDAQMLKPAFGASLLRSLMYEYKSEQRIIPNMKIPLLLVVSEGSVKSDSSYQKYCTAGYHYWEVKQTGHYPMLERPEAFNKQLDSAIRWALHPIKQNIPALK